MPKKKASKKAEIDTNLPIFVQMAHLINGDGELDDGEVYGNRSPHSHTEHVNDPFVTQSRNAG